MSKGNMLLGYSRGKLGDIVFKRVKGQQVQTPRVRKVANPRTNAQTVQRIAFASASKTAQHLREIVDHSFQGVKYGGDSINYFVSKLTKEIRQQMLGAQAAPSSAPFGTAAILPNLASGVAAGARALVSNGDLEGIPFNLGANNGLQIGYPTTQEILTAAKLGDFESIFGVPWSDQITILEGWPVELDYVSESELFYGVRFDWLRINFDADASPTASLFVAGSTTGTLQLNPAIIDQERSDLRCLDVQWIVVDGRVTIGTDYTQEVMGDIFGNDFALISHAAVIVSRYESNVWRRSASRLVLTPRTITQSAPAYEENYGYNSIDSVMSLDVTPEVVSEQEYLNKKKKIAELPSYNKWSLEALAGSWGDQASVTTVGNAITFNVVGAHVAVHLYSIGKPVELPLVSSDISIYDLDLPVGTSGSAIVSAVTQDRIDLRVNWTPAISASASFKMTVKGFVYVVNINFTMSV